MLLLEAADNGVPKLTGTATVTVYVTDVNDNTPLIHSVPYDLSVPEDVPVGTTVMQITVTDADTGLSQTLQYSILSGDYGQFTILADYGIIKTSTILDREVRSLYNMVVQVVDKGTPALTATTTTTLSILDVNDNNPVFTAFGPYYVQENVDNFTLVGQIAATDADIGVNAVLQYSLIETSSGIPDHFTIEPDTGILHTWGYSLDREKTNRYTVRIRVRDDGSPPLYTDRTVSIYITDHNDVRPVCVHGQLSLTLPENLPSGVCIADLNATDTDAGNNAAITYSIYFGDSAYQFFDVDSSSGVLTLKQTIDRELNSRFDFYVHATDGGGVDLLAGTCRVVIYVEDENDNYPSFAESFYSFELAFNAPKDYFISQVLATDSDYGLNGQVQYSFYQEIDDFAINYNSGKSCQSTLRKPQCWLNSFYSYTRPSTTELK